MTYKDTTFCTAQCGNMVCHRNTAGSYYAGGPVEDWMPVAMADFAVNCEDYVPVNEEEYAIELVS